ncbi:MAG: NAD(P)H-dependent glycerol-3-phosphate dehydrogenase, partial [Burkholderiales bacterium]
VFEGSHLYLRFSDDVAGASWAVILKNIYVPLIGAAEGAGLGDNIRGYLLAAALRELARIVVSFGGKADTVYGLAGVGDLVATATSPGSHHRSAGVQLGRGEAGALKASGVNIRGEGFHALAMLEKHRLVDFTQYPLLRAARSLLAEPKQARRILLDLCADPDVVL